MAPFYRWGNLRVRELKRRAWDSRPTYTSPYTLQDPSPIEMGSGALEAGEWLT